MLISAASSVDHETCHWDHYDPDSICTRPECDGGALNHHGYVCVLFDLGDGGLAEEGRLFLRVLD